MSVDEKPRELPETRTYPVASIRRQNRKLVHFHSGVTYYRPDGGRPGQIHVEGAGYLTIGTAEALISALAGACVEARKAEATGSMGETPDNMTAQED